MAGHNVINIPDVSPHLMASYVHFLYIGKLQTTLSSADTDSVRTKADEDYTLKAKMYFLAGIFGDVQTQHGMLEIMFEGIKVDGELFVLIPPASVIGKIYEYTERGDEMRWALVEFVVKRAGRGLLEEWKYPWEFVEDVEEARDHLRWGWCSY